MPISTTVDFSPLGFKMINTTVEYWTNKKNTKKQELITDRSRNSCANNKILENKNKTIKSRMFESSSLTSPTSAYSHYTGSTGSTGTTDSTDSSCTLGSTVCPAAAADASLPAMSPCHDGIFIGFTRDDFVFSVTDQDLGVINSMTHECAKLLGA
jgi:hypothetical protein